MHRRLSFAAIIVTTASFALSYAPLWPSYHSSSFLQATRHPVLPDNLLCSVKNIFPLNDLKERQNAILNRIERQIQEDSDASGLVKEEEEKEEKHFSTTDSLGYEWVRNDEQYPFAVRSLQPLIHIAKAAELRKEAESAWGTGQTSRFTYQRPGNYEVHVADLSSAAKEIVNECLRQKIYPWIRSVFGPFDSSSLHVYDALIIRYNATEATQSGAAIGAGQPLHRDLGLVSINIMLNEDFEGGGTFFENQLGSDNHLRPLKPIGVGHALAHYSSERHAGSATLRGVRDILVIFVSANEPPVQSALLKQCRSICEVEHVNDAAGGVLCRIRHLLTAVEVTPRDGEAWQYLGSSLMELSSIPSFPVFPQSLLECALQCFQAAALFTPCDSRIYNNMGLVYVRLATFPSLNVDEYSQKAEKAYQKGWELLDKSEKAGCDVTNDFDALTLNFGLHVSNQDRFAEACSILDRIISREASEDSRIIRDANELFSFCQKHIPRH